TNQMDNVDKRPGMLRSPKYTNKRVDEVFSARKSKFGVVSGKENAKENPSLEKTTTSNLKNVLVFSTSAAKRQQGSSCMENSATSGEVNNDEKLWIMVVAKVFLYCFCPNRSFGVANRKSKHVNDRNEVFFRIKRSTQLKKLMNAYCDRQSVDFNSIAFLFLH
ncbi:hypothetical protein S245_020423, partial [Arachis hypogaea]